VKRTHGDVDGFRQKWQRFAVGACVQTHRRKTEWRLGNVRFGAVHGRRVRDATTQVEVWDACRDVWWV